MHVRTGFSSRRMLGGRSWAAAVACAALLAACGGGADEPPPIPARAGAASVGPAGGSVDAVLEGGATVVLDVPPGALTSDVDFSIDPETPTTPGTLGLFTISPAGVTLLKPVTLTVTLPAGVQPGPDAGLTMDSANGAVPVGASIDPVTRRVSVQLSFLPSETALAGRAFPASAQRARPAAADAAARVRLRLEERIDSVIRANTLRILVTALQRQGSIDNAILVQIAADSLAPGAAAETLVLDDLVNWRNVVCPQQSFAVSALDTFNGADVVSFRRFAFDAGVWTLLARDMTATLLRIGNIAVRGCGGLPDDFRQPVIDKLPAFIDAVSRSLALLGPLAEFDQILSARIPELLQLEAFMQEFGLGSSVLNLIGDEAARLRSAAYDDCRDNGSQSKQALLLALEVGDAAFVAASRFTELDLRTDIQFCGMRMLLIPRDAAGNNLSQVEIGGAGNPPNQRARTAATASLAGATTLRIFGQQLRALVCPAGSQNNEQLVFEAGPVGGALQTLGRLTPSNQNTYLPDFKLDFDAARFVALRGPGQPANVRFVIRREGGLCSGAFANLTAHAILADVTLDFGSVQVTTTQLPLGILGGAYSASLVAEGGQQPYTWGASGLPAGLVLNTSTGAISGTPNEAGTFAVNVNVATADNLVDAASLSVTIGGLPGVAGLYIGTRTVLRPGEPSVLTPATIRIRQLGGRIVIENISDPVFRGFGYVLELSLDTGSWILLGDATTSTGFEFREPSLNFRLISLTRIIGNRLTYQEVMPGLCPECGNFIYDVLKQ